jgi:hypothetical protein
MASQFSGCFDADAEKPGTVIVVAYFGGEELTSIPRDSREANDLTQRVAELFEVSNEAANIRLCGLGYLVG